MLSSNLSAFQTFLAAALYLLLAVSQSVSAQINSPANTRTHTGGRESFYIVWYFRELYVEKTFHSFFLSVTSIHVYFSLSLMSLFFQFSDKLWIRACVCVSELYFFGCRDSLIMKFILPADNRTRLAVRIVCLWTLSSHAKLQWWNNLVLLSFLVVSFISWTVAVWPCSLHCFLIENVEESVINCSSFNLNQRCVITVYQSVCTDVWLWIRASLCSP